MEYIFPATKRELILVQFKNQVLLSEMEDLKKEVFDNKISPLSLKERDDLKVDILPAIHNTSEYVLLLSGDGFDYKDMKELMATVLADNSPDVFIYYSSYISIKRIKKDLVPFL